MAVLRAIGQESIKVEVSRCRQCTVATFAVVSMFNCKVSVHAKVWVRNLGCHAGPYDPETSRHAFATFAVVAFFRVYRLGNIETFVSSQ